MKMDTASATWPRKVGSSTRQLVVALFIAACAGVGGPAAAQEAKAISVVAGNAVVCSGDKAFVWVDENNNIFRGAFGDYSPRQIALPKLDDKVVARRAIGCSVKDGHVDMAYQESSEIANVREALLLKTIWLDGGGYRIVDENDSGERRNPFGPDFFINPAAATVVADDFSFRQLDGYIRGSIPVPVGSNLYFAEAIKKAVSIDDSETAICSAIAERDLEPRPSLLCQAIRFANGKIETRQLEVADLDAIPILFGGNGPTQFLERGCVARFGAVGPSSRPMSISFDCKVQGGALFQTMATYPTASGYVVWRFLQNGRLCRQRLRGTESYVVNAQCFRIEQDDASAALSTESVKALWPYTGIELPSQQGWSLRILGRGVVPPITSPLLPESEGDAVEFGGTRNQKIK